MRKSRVLAALACGALVAVFAMGPAAADTTTTFAAEAAGTGLSLSVGDVALDIGISEGSLTSSPTVQGLGAGVLQIEGTVAETSGNGSDTAELIDLELINDDALGTLSAGVARGTSTSTLAGPTSTNRGELLGVVLGLTPGGTGLVGTDPFAVASTSDVSGAGNAVTADATSDEVVIPISLGDEIVAPLCEVVGGIDVGLGEACEGAVDATSELTTVATIRILPSRVSCAVDKTTLEGSTDATAAIASVELFNDELVSIPIGQTVSLLEGTPLAIEIVAADTAEEVGEGTASATATGLRVDLLGEELPGISLVASEVQCAVGAEAVTTQPPTKKPPLPITGAPLGLLYAGGGALVAAGLGLRRFLKSS